MIKKNQSKNKSAFTLVEMAIVLFIISLLILLIVPNLSKQRTHADKVNTKHFRPSLIRRLSFMPTTRTSQLKQSTLKCLKMINI